MNLQDKTIGIWGFGAVGKSALAFLYKRCKQIAVMSQGSLSPEQEQLLADCNATFVPQADEKTVHSFLESHNYIVPSPGIDLRPYAQYKKKWLPEVDIFNDYATTKTIGITGTLGKTTVTTQLSELFSCYDHKAATGGNIGTPMLDLLQQQNARVSVIELSSFQLKHNHAFTPDIAILTNVYPNHLDWHGTFKDYLAAKMKLFVYQRNTQHALMPLSLVSLLQEHGYLKKMGAQLNFFTTATLSNALLKTVPPQSALYYFEGTKIKQRTAQSTRTVVDLKKSLAGAQRENTLISYAAFQLLHKGIIVPPKVVACQQLEHRMEPVKVINKVTFINDSKSTIAQATVAATHQISQPIILLLGGLSKGVNRAPFLKELPDTVKHIICFGKEARQLAQQCQSHHPAVTTAVTLEDAFAAAQQLAQPGMTVLFSPGGSSFDLFGNYEERGKRFKELVNMVC